MKRIGSMLIVLFVLLLAACANAPVETSASSAATPESAAMTPTPIPSATVEPTNTETPAPTEEVLDPAMAVEISDPALRSAVMATLSSLGQTFEGGITVENLLALEELVIVSPAWNHQPVIFDEIKTEMGAPDLLIQVADGINSLEGLQYARNLKRLIIVGNPPHLEGGTDNNLGDLSPLASLTNLEKLSLRFNLISDITPLAALENLADLSLQYSTGLNDISAVTALDNLKTLDLRHCYEVDFSVISSMTNLERLYLSSCEFDINLVSNMTKLTHLECNGGNLVNLWGLYLLVDMQTLDLSYNNISDIGVLAGMPDLETLNLYGNNDIEDISALAGLENLKTFAIDPEIKNSNAETVQQLKGRGCTVYTQDIADIFISLH